MSETEDGDKKKEMQPLPYGAFEQISSNRYTFYISEEIGEPQLYIPMINSIRNATENDHIVLYLNTPGGDLTAGVQIINAIKSSSAKITTVLDGQVASMGTLIFLAGDEYVVHEHGIFMIHNYSGHAYGKGNEVAAQVAATVQWFNKLARDSYVPFLTEQELEKVLNGQDMWMLSDEVKNRLLKMVEIRDNPPQVKKKRSKHG